MPTRVQTLEDGEDTCIKVFQAGKRRTGVNFITKDRGRYFRGRISNFNQSEAREHCFLASDWLKSETLPRKYRTLYRNVANATIKAY